MCATNTSSSLAIVTPVKAVEFFLSIMKRFNLPHSAKDIMAPSKKLYLNMYIDSSETFMRKADWRVQQYLHPEKFTTKETFNFKSLRNPPKVPELDAFRHDFLNIMKWSPSTKKH